MSKVFVYLDRYYVKYHKIKTLGELADDIWEKYLIKKLGDLVLTSSKPLEFLGFLLKDKRLSGRGKTILHLSIELGCLKILWHHFDIADWFVADFKGVTPYDLMGKDIKYLSDVFQYHVVAAVSCWKESKLRKMFVRPQANIEIETRKNPSLLPSSGLSVKVVNTTTLSMSSTSSSSSSVFADPVRVRSSHMIYDCPQPMRAGGRCMIDDVFPSFNPDDSDN